MARTLEQVIGSLPPERQSAVAVRHEALRAEVSLAEVRKAAGRAQADMAAALGIKQPSVSKIERQTDMYLSTLRTYVEALGGTLELVVRLPEKPEIRLKSLGEIVLTSDEKKARPRGGRAKVAAAVSTTVPPKAKPARKHASVKKAPVARGRRVLSA